VIGSLPVVIVGSEADVGDHEEAGGPAEERSCPICLNELVAGEEARLLLCHHMFHRQCVDEWLRVNASCPTCRKSILPDTGGTPAAPAPTTVISATTSTSSLHSAVVERRRTNGEYEMINSR
jgi:ribosomal protein S27E